MMIICVFDTETTSLDKPFCYNIGYIVENTETHEILCARDFVVEQIWHNLPLFQTAYYAEKRPLYVSRMRARTCKLDKFGYICQQMKRDFQNYKVEAAYAFNSSFDERVFNFNCDWYKCTNPFDTIPMYDIRAYAIERIGKTVSYQDFCEAEGLLTENGNYQTTAESFYRYLYNKDFVEEHTALSDSECELEILRFLYRNGVNITEEKTAPKYIERKVAHEWTIQKGRETIMKIESSKVTVYKKNFKIKFE